MSVYAERLIKKSQEIQKLYRVWTRRIVVLTVINLLLALFFALVKKS